MVDAGRPDPLNAPGVETRAPYSAKYLALRASQGQLPAVKRKGQWLTSGRAVTLYLKTVGRDR